MSLEEQYSNIIPDLELIDNESVAAQLSMIKDNSKTYQQFLDEQLAGELAAEKMLLSNKVSAQAYVKAYNMDPELIKRQGYGTNTR